jgi:hypothetical protein
MVRAGKLAGQRAKIGGSWLRHACHPVSLPGLPHLDSSAGRVTRYGSIRRGMATYRCDGSRPSRRYRAEAAVPVLPVTATTATGRTVLTEALRP